MKEQRKTNTHYKPNLSKTKKSLKMTQKQTTNYWKKKHWKGNKKVNKQN